MQLDRGEIIGLAIALVAAAAALAVGLGTGHPAATPVPVLSAPPADWPQSDRILLIELPDSGGYLANGQLLDLRILADRLRQVAQANPGFPRGLYVRMGTRRAPADLLPVLAAAEQVGWRVFDADKSGVPRPIPIESLPH